MKKSYIDILKNLKESNTKSQSANDRIERLQSEMLYVQEEIVKLKNRELP